MSVAQLFLPTISVYTNNAMMTFGERLALLRESLGISRATLARLSGLRESVLYNIEKGNRPASEDNLRKLADVSALNMTYEKLGAWQILGKATQAELLYIIEEIDNLKDSPRNS